MSLQDAANVVQAAFIDAEAPILFEYDSENNRFQVTTDAVGAGQTLSYLSSLSLPIGMAGPMRMTEAEGAIIINGAG